MEGKKINSNKAHAQAKWAKKNLFARLDFKIEPHFYGRVSFLCVLANNSNSSSE